MLRFSSVKGKIATLAGLCLLGSALVLIGWNLFVARQTADFVQEKTEAALNRDAEAYLGTIANEQARKLRLEFHAALDVARDLASVFGTMAGPESTLPVDQRRAEFNHILKNVLEREPTLNGTYTAWEPAAVDGRDDTFRNRRETGTDASGRFIPYWNRNASGHIGMQPLVEYDSQALHPNGVMKGGWYLVSWPERERTRERTRPAAVHRAGQERVAGHAVGPDYD